jgi:hypothetical protein
MKHGDRGAERPNLRRSVRQHLELLGDSPPRIADRLGAEGVQGVPGVSNECALARYLQAVIATEQSVESVAVFERSLRIRRSGFHPPVFVILPNAASTFVRQFDTGIFPQLVDRRGRGDPAQTDMATGLSGVTQDQI